ncbi:MULTISPECIES: hypothetical protein [unclassified Cryobacterium]|uniref:hypothetical protein n=1 Tax=unclassified Cryobacterium TaxID=2649013 RepID=UPI00144806DD|nr:MULTISPECIES: hypothetical protein [unclassified Cryobacterium]
MPRLAVRNTLAGLVAVLLLSGCDSTSEPPTPSGPKLSAAEEQLVQESLDGSWRMVVLLYADAVRPEVERVRLVEQSDQPTAIADCLAEQGYDVVVDSQGSISSTGGGEAFQVAYYTCEATYPLHPDYLRPLSEAQLAHLYNYFLNTLKPCLEAEGYDVPPAPSLQRFLETYNEGGGWIVYGEVAGAKLPPGEWGRINALCPQIPDDLYG